MKKSDLPYKMQATQKGFCLFWGPKRAVYESDFHHKPPWKKVICPTKCKPHTRDFVYFGALKQLYMKAIFITNRHEKKQFSIQNASHTQGIFTTKCKPHTRDFVYFGARKQLYMKAIFITNRHEKKRFSIQKCKPHTRDFVHFWAVYEMRFSWTHKGFCLFWGPKRAVYESDFHHKPPWKKAIFNTKCKPHARDFHYKMQATHKGFCLF